MEPERMRLSLRSYPDHEDTHVHSFHQAVLAVDGVMEIEIGGVAGSILGRQGVIIASGTRHVFHVSSANRFIVLDIPRGTCPSMVPESPFFLFDDSFAELIRYTWRELVSGGLDMEGECHLAALIAGKIRQSSSPLRRWSDFGAQALAVMRQRHAERLSMAEVARACGVGASRFHELFRRETGRTPGQMLAEVRLDHAEALLRSTRLPIAEIALMVGFSEQSALTRSLRRQRGTTPAAVRRAARQSSSQQR